MKKVISSIVIAIIISTAMPHNVQAQDYALSTMPIRKTFIQPEESTLDTTVTLETTKLKLENSTSKSMKEVKRAAREFKQFNRLSKNFEARFKGASNVIWDKHETGFNGFFTKDGLRNMVCYSKYGYLLNSMVTYYEDRLDKSIKRIIKDAYEDYKILLVNEVRQDGITVYVVTIENEKNIKLVTVCEGEINIYKEYKKAS